MISATDYQKTNWLAGGPKSVRLKFDDGTILTNENIVQESLVVTQTITDTQNFSLGQVFSTECRIKIFNDNNVSYAGKWFELRLSDLLVAGVSFDIGKYKVESEKTSDDRVYKEIVAYDALHDILSRDFAEWHNSKVFTTSLSNYADAFFDEVGLDWSLQGVANENMIINRTNIVSSYSGADVLRCILELFGSFIHIAPPLYRAYIRPVNPISTSQTYDLSSDHVLLGGFKREDYRTPQIACVHIRTIDGLTSGSSPSTVRPGQTYYITNNPLVSGKTSSELATIASNIRSKINQIFFYPSTVHCFAIPWLEVGDTVRIYTGGVYYRIPIFNRVMSGITAIRDTYTANGTEQFMQISSSGNITVQTTT